MRRLNIPDPEIRDRRTKFEKALDDVKELRNGVMADGTTLVTSENVVEALKELAQKTEEALEELDKKVGMRE